MPKKEASKKGAASGMSPEHDSTDPDSWIYDSLVGFLKGPVWQVPIMSFIEQKSLIFEPDAEHQNEEEYQKVHEQYKQLVDFMLGSFMEDMSITADKFQHALKLSASRDMKKQFQTTAFEQVWAADDYPVFKRMMIQRNIELQLQALELLQHKYGVLPDSLKPTKKVKKLSKSESVSSEEDIDTEAKLMEEVKRKSLAEHQAMSSQMDKENKEMEMAIAKSIVDQQRLQNEKKTQEDILEHQMKKLSMKEVNDASGDPSPRPDHGTSQAEPEVDPSELKRRTEFLKAQRDKLLAMKKAEREKQLEEVEKSSQMKSRPKSARAARSAFGGKSTPKIDPKTLEARRALAEKLKAEVIGN